jgi:hypothetical protein
MYYRYVEWGRVWAPFCLQETPLASRHISIRHGHYHIHPPPPLPSFLWRRNIDEKLSPTGSKLGGVKTPFAVSSNYLHIQIVKYVGIRMHVKRNNILIRICWLLACICKKSGCPPPPSISQKSENVPPGQ